MLRGFVKSELLKMGWKMKKSYFSIALHIIDDSIIYVFQSKLWKSCRKVCFLPWASHFRCYCFFFSSNSFERNIESSLPSFKPLSWSMKFLSFQILCIATYISLRIVVLIRKLLIRVLLNQLNSAFSKFSFCLTSTFFLYVQTSPGWKALLIFLCFQVADLLILYFKVHHIFPPESKFISGGTYVLQTTYFTGQ